MGGRWAGGWGWDGGRVERGLNEDGGEDGGEGVSKD